MLIVYLFVKLMNIISMMKYMLNNVQFLYLPVYTTVTKESSIN